VKVYDLAPNADRYYRQNGSGPGANEIAPGVTCKPTSTIMGHDVGGWPVPSHGAAGFEKALTMYRQPEDNLTALCRSPEGEAYMLAIDPGLKGTPPNEVWFVIAWALRKIYCRKTIVGPRWDWSLREALWGIARLRLPFVASTSLSKGGHVVMISGYRTEQDEVPPNYFALDLEAVKEIIIDDPYGKHLVTAGYDVNQSGYHNRYTLAEFKNYWRGIGIQILRKE